MFAALLSLDRCGRLSQVVSARVIRTFVPKHRPKIRAKFLMANYCKLKKFFVYADNLLNIKRLQISKLCKKLKTNY